MATQAQSKVTAPRTLVGWQGITFTLPPDWNVTGFSTDRANGYLKVDSPGTMFVQIKWTDPQGRRRPITLGDWLQDAWRRKRGTTVQAPAPDLRAMLDAFLKETGKQARKSKAAFDCKVKPETDEAGGARKAHHFAWTGGGQGQGKIWHCATCGRVVIAQVVGQGRDNVSDAAAQLFSGITDHAEEGWMTWALYDLVAAAPEEFVLKQQKLMSGYLKLEFERRGERLTIERWGLASITRKKFTLAEWFEQTCGVRRYGAKLSDVEVHGHPAVRAQGGLRAIGDWYKALKTAVITRRPAIRYEGCVWECEESNKIYAVQLWHSPATQGLLDEVVARCACH